MRILNTIGFAVCVSWMIAGCANNSVPLPSDEVIIQKKTQASVHPTEHYFLGQVQVRLTDDNDLSAFMDDAKVKRGITMTLLDKVPNYPIYLFELNSLDPVDSVVKSLREDSRVVLAARNREINLNQFTTNDPLLSTQWALSNTGQDAPRSLAGKAGADISMDASATEGSYDVVVGIIDTGIDYTHEDLAVTEVVDGKVQVMPGSNIWVNPGEISGNGLNDDGNADRKHNIEYVDDVYGYNFVKRNGDPRDDMGHGTHVAGTIGALRNNMKGVSGIVGKVSMMALKFLSAEGSGSDFDAQLAIYYAIDMQKRFPEKRFILSNSWGSAGRESTEGDRKDPLLMAFVEASNAGILSVAAAGNDATSNRFDPHYPANYSNKIPNFLAVAATNNLDQLAGFSSYGYDTVQVAAPGMMIMSTLPEDLEEQNGGKYAAWSGTSMATPHVSGLAAAVWAANMGMSANDVRNRIMDTVDVLPQLHGSVSTSGRINVKRAMSGDITRATMPVAKEIPWVIRAPLGNDSQYEMLTKHTEEGAKEIQVCFSEINLQNKFDWIEIMGADFRVKDMLTGVHSSAIFDTQTKSTSTEELCAAPVIGDTVYIRLIKKGSSMGSASYETKLVKVVQ
jgi:subtilisin family serine protease